LPKRTTQGRQAQSRNAEEMEDGQARNLAQNNLLNKVFAFLPGSKRFVILLA
jgi:hypothetical protein